MKRKYDHFQDHLEWEILDPEQEITHLTFETGLYDINKDCIIKFSRDNQQDIVAIISGVLDNPKDIEPNIDNLRGTFITKETITGFSKDGIYKYKLSGIAIGSSNFTFISASNTSVKFQADLLVDRIEKSFNGNNRPTEIIQEWYLTGKTKINFPRSTERIVDKTFKRLRNEIDKDVDFSLVKSSGSSRDHILVKLSDTSFIVCKVPKEFGPDWSFNMSIEYRQSFGRIPSEEEREGISEFVSFVFGNQFLQIGQTSYDKSSNLTLQEYQNPWGDNVVSKCQKQGLPPVEIGNFHDWGRAELLLNELINTYLSQRNTLQLKDALWKYWLAKYSSLGANLPILSSAVETLAERVLKTHPEIKHCYIEFKAFSELIIDELSSIKKKLEGNTHKEIIIRKLQNAAQRGSNEKLEMMFEIIKLPIDKIERKAIKARNKMAHSSLGDIDEDEIKETIRLTRAYETLFNRILLKILSYNGKYIDYYTFGHPNRNINEAIPE